ncbi:uncharacterized protein LOC111339834 [Stylophora pistillata]|uniref:uncharacterized protein LOC111339834 n=1 Tax=Stylophora pistillata TaxID=50429 RepID=UPI000C0433E7|nr:uncharacterized protein LOC111339834 [Stylophora pistillata]
MSKPRPVRRRSESLSELAQDLQLLCVKEEVTDMERAKELREKRIAELRKTNGPLGTGYQRILGDIEQTLDRRQVLEKYYLKVKENLQETQAVSETEINDFRREAEVRLEDLGTKRYPVLILGETSAGKSSLINLLLNDSIMPISIKQSTLTICEISYGAIKEAVLHFANRRGLSLVLTGQRFDKYKDYIKKPIEDENWCEKIEIRIPNLLLKGGVVIIDSPGIGDSKSVSEITLKYLSRAYAFIYVINTPNAGGLQKDRLMLILSEWIKLYKGKDGCGIPSESAIFVCNKWDEVEEQSNRNQEENPERHIIDSLKKNIPGLDGKFQIIKMSVSRATSVQKKFNVMSDDLNSLVNRLQRLLPLCIERKTEFFYFWISGQLCSLSDQLKGEMYNAKRNKEERLKAREELDEKLSKLKEGNPIREIEGAIILYVKQVEQELASYLQTDEFKRNFCRWTENPLPKTEEGQNFSKMKEAFSRCIEQRFETLLQNWERRTNFFTQARAELEALFNKGFLEFEREIRDIDRVLTGSDVEDCQPFEIHPGRIFSPLDPGRRKFLVMTGLILWTVLVPVGLTAGFLTAPVLGVLAFGKHLKELQLKNNCCQTLTDLSKKFLDDFIRNKIPSYVQDRFSEETNRIAKIKRCHQQLITKYEQRCKDLTKSEDESREKEILEKYSPLHSNLKNMNENLIFDAIQNGIQVMYPSCQLDLRRLNYNEKEREAHLGKGTYGTVFKGRYSPPGHEKTDVAVKKIREHPDKSNVATFLKEAAMLKQLEHKHIVTFYGVGIDVQNRELVSLVLVFDLCIRSLNQQIFENDEYIPWKTASAAAWIMPRAKQILDALEFIHSKNVVHRDLKLANILISKDDYIKVADLGLATFEDKIIGTMCGTQPYMAPEVMEGKLYSTKVDIYSFGLMMWEMWFGKRVFTELRREEFFTTRIKDEDYRPQIPENGNLPPAKWIELMTSSWQSDSSLRPTATKCKDIIKTISVDA